MAEKVKTLNLERNHKTHLYFVDGQGNVCCQPKGGGESQVLHPNACVRDNNYLYFIDKEGDVSRTPRKNRKDS